jgi:uncharacterized repeat protein (TIGR03803 family)
VRYFTPTDDGAVGLILEGTSLYGTTAEGGGGACHPQHGCGTAYRLAPYGTETVLYTVGHKRHGGSPAGLMKGGDGQLYGTTTGNGHGEKWDST